MRNAAWVAQLKDRVVIVTLPGWLADRNNLPLQPSGTVRAVTAKAIALDVGRRQPIWLPLSKIEWIEQIS